VELNGLPDPKALFWLEEGPSVTPARASPSDPITPVSCWAGVESSRRPEFGAPEAGAGDDSRLIVMKSLQLLLSIVIRYKHTKHLQYTMKVFVFFPKTAKIYRN
jgi:hypothetical protein